MQADRHVEHARAVGAQTRDRAPMPAALRCRAPAAPGPSAMPRRAPCAGPRAAGRRAREALQERLGPGTREISARGRRIEAGGARIGTRPPSGADSKSRRRGRPELPVDELTPATQRRCRAREIHAACSASGTPVALWGALSQLSSVTHIGLAPAGRPCAGARLPQQRGDLAVSDTATSSEERRGRSGLSNDRGWKASTSRWGFSDRSPAASRPDRAGHRRNVTGAIAPDTGRFAVGGDAGGDHGVGAAHGLNAGVEAVRAAGRAAARRRSSACRSPPIGARGSAPGWARSRPGTSAPVASTPPS